MSGMTLDRAPLQARLALQEAPAAAGTARRMAALGLRRGAELMLLQATAGGGRLASVGGSRIALGPAVLRQLRVELIA